MNANKTPDRGPQGRDNRAQSAINTADGGPQGRENSLIRPEDGYFELVHDIIYRYAGQSIYHI